MIERLNINNKQINNNKMITKIIQKINNNLKNSKNLNHRVCKKILKTKGNVDLNKYYDMSYKTNF